MSRGTARKIEIRLAAAWLGLTFASIVGATLQVGVFVEPAPAERSCGWSVSPDFEGLGGFGISNTRPNDAWAVGYNTIQHWNGTTWNSVEFPQLDEGGLLYAVDALSSGDVFGVGVRGGSPTRSLIVQGGDSDFQVASSPNPGLYDTFLYDVDAIREDDVWAVGAAVHEVRAQATEAILHWDGREWTDMASPAPFTYQGLNGVFALSSRDVWAVGFTTDDIANNWRTLIEHWDGDHWEVVPSPNVAGFNHLYSISGTSKQDIWAVGTGGPQGAAVAITQHWDGHEWTLVPNPTEGDRSVLRSVLALAPNDAWAVGWSTIGDLDRSLIQHWNGHEWTLVTGGDADLPSVQLLSIAGSSPRHLWAAGSVLASYCD